MLVVFLVSIFLTLDLVCIWLFELSLFSNLFSLSVKFFGYTMHLGFDLSLAFFSELIKLV